MNIRKICFVVASVLFSTSIFAAGMTADFSQTSADIAVNQTLGTINATVMNDKLGIPVWSPFEVYGKTTQALTKFEVRQFCRVQGNPNHCTANVFVFADRPLLRDNVGQWVINLNAGRVDLINNPKSKFEMFVNDKRQVVTRRKLVK